MNRERKIAQFAKEYGLHLTFYWQGQRAVFERERADVRQATANARDEEEAKALGGVDRQAAMPRHPVIWCS